jgi:hypothetical protein
VAVVLAESLNTIKFQFQVDTISSVVKVPWLLLRDTTHVITCSNLILAITNKLIRAMHNLALKASIITNRKDIRSRMVTSIKALSNIKAHHNPSPISAQSTPIIQPHGV